MLSRRQSSFKRMGQTTVSVPSQNHPPYGSERWSQMDPIYAGFLHVYRNRFFGKWKRFMGAIFDENSTGHARLELYGSDKQLSTINPAKTVLFSECIAIRIVNFKENQHVIQIQQRSAPVMLIIAEDIEQWHKTLCRVAFPNQFVAIGSQSCSPASPCYSGEYAIPADVRRMAVVLQRISGTSCPALIEGSYDMYLNQSIVISNGVQSVKWDYLQITWFATGYNCFAVEVTSEGRYEFGSSEPNTLLHALRRHRIMKNVDTPPRFNTKNSYNYFYVPAPITPDSAVCTPYVNLTPGCLPLQNVGRPRADSELIPSSGGGGYDMHLAMERMNAAESRRFSKLPFFHRRASSGNHERAEFEMNADDEWIREKDVEEEDVNRNNTDWKSSESAMHISRPMEFTVNLDELIATNKVLQLAQLDDSSSSPLPMTPKAVSEIYLAANERDMMIHSSIFEQQHPEATSQFPPNNPFEESSFHEDSTLPKLCPPFPHDSEV